jgi:hypothetical protein
MNIFNRRVHKALCRHSEGASLTDYLEATVFQLDACRERGIVEVISTLLRFKHALFTRSCVKLNTLRPDKRKTNLGVSKPEFEVEGSDCLIEDDIIEDVDDSEGKSDEVYEVYANLLLARPCLKLIL